MRKTITGLHKYCYRIIDSRLERKKAGGKMGGPKAGKDLLELFIDQGINREELLPVLLNFIVAGRDTTAQSLAWFFLEMWKHPEHIAKIRETLVPVLGAPAEQRPMDFEDYKELPYLHACFYEAIRVRLPRAAQDVVSSRPALLTISSHCTSFSSGPPCQRTPSECSRTTLSSLLHQKTLLAIL